MVRVTADGVGANVRRMTDEVECCAGDGVELVLFTEFFLHGYDGLDAGRASYHSHIIRSKSEPRSPIPIMK